MTVLTRRAPSLSVYCLFGADYLRHRCRARTASKSLGRWLMRPKPLEVEIYRPINPLWLNSLRWVGPAHYDLKVGVDDLQTNCRVIANGQLLCHLIPSAMSSHERQEFFKL